MSLTPQSKRANSQDATEQPSSKKPKTADLLEIAREALTCAVCLELILPPIQQCLEGHPICDSCMRRLPCGDGRFRCCPTCRTEYPAKRVRNLIADQIAEMFDYPCPYKTHGCRNSMVPSELFNHVNVCRFNPEVFKCPVQHCSWMGLLDNFQVHLTAASKPDPTKLSSWLHSNATAGSVEQTQMRSMVRRFLWLDGIASSFAFKEDSPQILSFPDAVFMGHANKVGDLLKIGIRWVSPPMAKPCFEFRIAIEAGAANGGLQRWGSSNSLPVSETDLMKGPQCLVVDMATARALSSKQTSFSHESDVLHIQYTITRKAD